ncbi:hypothetical protein ISF_08778 [Cordyceps fumosorosea ARSEF 2679]|uniref:DUF788 domain-containing protein n=1 Tax=Cordyceps fumosorosea (strain ARSEF 2679) TaxID=1081104 RepID=A0A162I7N6_CORFA|nr:hypothetical protein ISF_08778 [Cordyceps fumosorosea ARSEF 2679]OAA53425.1 hypothetical protein ISF_08778 [Cordyceps fumosorosea ARSEF 2679]
MAQKAKKDRAKANAAALKNLHTGSAIVNLLVLASHFLWRPRSLLLHGVLSAPAFACEYVLERSGRPRHDPATGALRSAGEDLAAAGLTEYMFDVVWVTWAAAVLAALFGPWGWALWAVVPAYGLYMASGLLGWGRSQLAQMQGQGQQPEAAAAGAQGNRRQRRAA